MNKYDVIAIGELNVDLVLSGLSCMPVSGQEILAERCSLTLGSSTAICASAAAGLGLDTGFIGKIGSDRFGKVVIKSLKRNKVDISNIIIDNNIDTGITVSLSREKDRALVTYLGSIKSLTFKDIDIDLLKRCRHVHVGSFFIQEGLRKDIPRLFAEAKRMGLTTSLDAGWDDSENWDYGIIETLKYTDIFLPNDVEAPRIAKKNDVKKILKYLNNYAKIVVIKCGPQGAAGKWGNEYIEQEPYDLKPVDKTGAGDSFNAGFIYGFLKGLNLKECMSYGNACGSISITKLGGAASCANIKEVENLIKFGEFK